MDDDTQPKRGLSAWYVMLIAILVGAFGWLFAVFGGGNYVIGKGLIVLFLLAPALFVYGLIGVIRGKKLDLDK